MITSSGTIGLVRIAGLLLLAACGRIGFDTSAEPPDVTPRRTIAAGTRFACALADSTMHCWGANSFGQLGDGSQIAHAPAPVSIGANPLSIAASEEGGDDTAGSSSACAIDAVDGILCWGRNDRGQLGDGSLEDRAMPTPIGITDAIDVVIGALHSCALHESGAVSCWGANTAGQIDTSGADHLTPVVVAQVTDAVDISLGTGHTCTRHGDGHVSCWGDNTFGQLGDGTVGTNRAVGEVVLPGPYASISAGEEFSCAITMAGIVECWGRNQFGQLGDGSDINQPSPTPMQDVDVALQVAAAHNNSCVLQQGGIVRCAGNANLGECGDGVIGGERHTPARVVGISDFVEISVGFHLGCGRRAGGEVVCWGTNDAGELIDPSLGVSSATPVIIPLP